MQGNMVGQNIIITERISALRQLGRNALRGKWKTAIVAMCIVILCLSVPPLILNHTMGLNIASLFPAGSDINPEEYSQFSNAMPEYNLLSMVYSLCVAGAFNLGCALFFLASFRGHEVGPKDVFLGFERFAKSLGLLLFMMLFVFLWTLPSCFVAGALIGILAGPSGSPTAFLTFSPILVLAYIPGIIAAIRYSQSFYVLADDPTKTIRQCVNESKRMMKGNKAKYFLLNLSFIGWAILSLLPMGMVSAAVENMTDSTVAFMVAGAIGSLFYAPVMAYINSTQAGFYEILAGHLIKETAPAPVTADQIDVEAPIAHIEEVIESVEEKNNEAPETGREAGEEAVKEPEEDKGIDVENIMNESNENRDENKEG